MDISLNTSMGDLIIMVLFIFLPLLFILVGAAVGFMNALYYILSITWFGMGMIFYKAISTS